MGMCPFRGVGWGDVGKAQRLKPALPWGRGLIGFLLLGMPAWLCQGRLHWSWWRYSPQLRHYAEASRAGGQVGAALCAQQAEAVGEVEEGQACSHQGEALLVA